MDRLFLDANVLFSAAYDPNARIARLFALSDVELITSAYAAAEALRNLEAKRPARVATLSELLQRTRLTRQDIDAPVPAGIDLPKDDLPILQAAIGSGANFLLTGDKHFRPYYGRVIEGVLILRPGDYLRMTSE